MDASIGRERAQVSLNHDGVAFAEKVGKGTLVADKDVGKEVSDNELHLWGGGGGVDNTSLHDETAEAEAGLGRISGELRHGIGGGDVEKKLVLEVSEHDYDEPSDTTEGEAVSPKAAIL